MRTTQRVLFAAASAAALILSSGALAAQTPAYDPSARLQEVLPADVADRVLARIAAARARELPAQALENRALKFAARGVPPADIARAIDQHADRLEAARGLLAAARSGRAPQGDEIEAGAEAMRQGVDGSAVSAIAKAAPSGRSLAVPLFVIGTLVERGLPSDEALSQVRDRLLERASDDELEGMSVARGNAGSTPGATGLDRADTQRPTTPVGPAATPRGPAGVPQNGGKATRPTLPPAGTARRP